MIRFIVPAICAMGLLVACEDANQGDQPNAPGRALQRDMPQDYGAHNAMNALDYFGTYAWRAVDDGQDPVTIELTLLEDGQFVFRETVRDVGDLQSGLIETRGRYIWDVSGTVITLVAGDDDVAQFFVGENFVKRVDVSADEVVTLRKVF